MQLCKLGDFAFVDGTFFSPQDNKRREKTVGKFGHLSNNFPKHLTSFFAAFFLRPSTPATARKKFRQLMVRREKWSEELAREKSVVVVDVYRASASRPHRERLFLFFSGESVAMLTPHNRLMFHDFYYAGHRDGNRRGDTFWREDRAGRSPMIKCRSPLQSLDCNRVWENKSGS
jgi:hypothetical protein